MRNIYPHILLLVSIVFLALDLGESLHPHHCKATKSSFTFFSVLNVKKRSFIICSILLHFTYLIILQKESRNIYLFYFIYMYALITYCNLQTPIQVTFICNKWFYICLVFERLLKIQNIYIINRSFYVFSIHFFYHLNFHR